MKTALPSWADFSGSHLNQSDPALWLTITATEASGIVQTNNTGDGTVRLPTSVAELGSKLGSKQSMELKGYKIYELDLLDNLMSSQSPSLKFECDPLLQAQPPV
jgi:hypothetical protein